ncbi:trimeric intracellular cation channel family protein [Halovulum sp. GXIMD14794]
MNAVEILDYSGVALFAATGALAASRKQLDIIGFVFLAALTGTGGGTVRDLVLDVPVFWVAQPVYILVCAVTAVCLYFTAHLAESRYRWLLWLDGAALAAYCVFGAYKGLAVSGSAVIAVVMGMLTGTLGGILRDVLSDEPSVLLRREIYVTAAGAGAAVFVVADALNAPLALAAFAGFASAFALRACALALDWQLPTYRSRPGRPADKI